jgi:hypothetical protein
MLFPRTGKLGIPLEVIRRVDEQQAHEWKELLKRMSPVYEGDPRLPIAIAIENEIKRIELSLA